MVMDAPEQANPLAIGNVGAMLVTHLIAQLVRKGILTQQDVEAIFQETQGRYTSVPVGLSAGDEWGKQTSDILALLEGDVIQFSSEVRVT